MSITDTERDNRFTVCTNRGRDCARGRGVIAGTAKVIGKRTLETTADVACILRFGSRRLAADRR